MQPKFEHFDLVFFDEDMELPEPKTCKKKLFDIQEENTSIKYSSEKKKTTLCTTTRTLNKIHKLQK